MTKFAKQFYENVLKLFKDNASELSTNSVYDGTIHGHSLLLQFNFFSFQILVRLQ
jgi:hypothetical protein